ncbi:ATP-binding protein [Leptolyngbya sp. GGD]|uniref:ATP-binding protein n=1 Tax=Leptolyngbya sp. GGD TaxID=2997907 RepID=UPI00227AD7A7|nr:ATP-binding protein [Leptolyngbya sp. GGD]MCY6490322.1 ATP-binding protein [Leptolyngbya sp. GGD]
MNLPSTSAQDVEPMCHHLVLSNRLDDLDILSAWLNPLFQHLQISPRGAFRIELVLMEAVTNVMQYAYEAHETGEIQVALHALNQTVTLELRDNGRPFDPLQRPDVQLPKSLEEATEGGLGIHLIRSYVDECRYSRDGTHNVLTMKICDSDEG